MNTNELPAEWFTNCSLNVQFVWRPNQEASGKISGVGNGSKCVIIIRVKYTDGPCGLLKFWIWSLAFQKNTDGPCGLHFVMYLVPNFGQKYMDGPCDMHFVTHLVSNLDQLKRLNLLAGD
ncbi:hypothetical protein Hanom_Chr02g00113121 [Helianthus anomalus]